MNKKLHVSGWIEEENQQLINIPEKCPKCNSKLIKVDASKDCGIIFIYCNNLKCRWAEIYEV